MKILQKILLVLLVSFSSVQVNADTVIPYAQCYGENYVTNGYFRMDIHTTGWNETDNADIYVQRAGLGYYFPVDSIEVKRFTPRYHMSSSNDLQKGDMIHVHIAQGEFIYYCN